ncbi:hypothetical protein A2U01_0035908 [Trifolium medium]|uniref:Uncharacterized protein n=1 Tax=Trifolium medium TaxID=97028 RepID=A0A392PTZ2_9FABA|nr:hypothetical protein [Trifolium medium]
MAPTMAVPIPAKTFPEMSIRKADDNARRPSSELRIPRSLRKEAMTAKEQPL